VSSSRSSIAALGASDSKYYLYMYILKHNNIFAVNVSSRGGSHIQYCSRAFLPCDTCSAKPDITTVIRLSVTLLIL